MFPELLNAHLSRPLADVRDDADLIAVIYTHAKNRGLPGYQAQCFADWLDNDIEEWGPEHATLREVIAAAHQVWNDR